MQKAKQTSVMPACFAVMKRGEYIKTVARFKRVLRQEALILALLDCV